MFKELKLGPIIFSAMEMSKNFKVITMLKPTNDKKQFSLNYFEFIQYLTRMVLSEKQLFGSIYEENKKSDKLNESDSVQEEPENEKSKNEAIGSKEVKYMEGFLLYLGLPREKKQLDEYLKSLRTENVKLQPSRLILKSKQTAFSFIDLFILFLNEQRPKK